MIQHQGLYSVMGRYVPAIRLLPQHNRNLELKMYLECQESKKKQQNLPHPRHSSLTRPPTTRRPPAPLAPTPWTRRGQPLSPPTAAVMPRHDPLCHRQKPFPCWGPCREGHAAESYASTDHAPHHHDPHRGRHPVTMLLGDDPCRQRGIARADSHPAMKRLPLG
jgi:hypothetical protein